MSKLLIKNATVVTMTETNQLSNNCSIAIQDSYIHSIGSAESILADFKPDQTIDAKGMVALPGLVNCHTHAAMTLLRGYADDLPLMPWLETKIWPFEEHLTAEDVYWGTMLAIVEMIKSGTTTFIDMYFFMDKVAQAVEETGIRAVLSRGMVGFNPNAQTALEESKSFTETWHGTANGRITTMLGPHAPNTCPPDYLKKVLAVAEQLNVGIHIHIAETLSEVESIAKDYGKTPVEYLQDTGLLSRPTVGAHCVHLSDNDIAILKSNDVRVAHNPESNMKLASGIAPIPKLMAAGITVGLGTDGASSNNDLDLLAEMKSASFLQKVATMDPTVLPAYTSLELATINGAKVLRLDQEIGTLEPGKKADIILFDFEQPHLYPQHDIFAHLTYAAQSADIKTVIIDGKILMKDRKMVALDEEKIMHEAQKRAFALAAMCK